MTFEELKLTRQFLNAIEEAGYQHPTPIQEKAIPPALAGHDIIGIAQTGTGKTAAYALPMLMKLKYAQGIHPRALVLVPTHELTQQVSDAIMQLARYTDLRCLPIFGGKGIKKQIEQLSEGVDIVVATPGRLMDVYLAGGLQLKHVKTFIIDEADRMLDLGFMPQIRRILEVLPRKRQNLLFSATFSEKVERLCEEFIEYPVKVEITPQATPADTVEQYLYEVPNIKTKINLLMHLLEQESFKKVLVFARRRRIATAVYKYLQRKLGKDSVRVIHANKDQNTRANALEAFRKGEIRLLIATDVAARGIDVSEVTHVINFEVPVLYEEYVHRIGRTGRAFQHGTAITFANPAEEYHIKQIEKLIKMKIPRLPLPDAVEVVETPFEEHQEMAREIDKQRRKEDSSFQGAFHEKKRKTPRTPSKTKNQKLKKKSSNKRRG
ncbi:ATP-dependent RNA helicase RhlE [Thermonema lapsum]|uniref:ATP-dependent RNA helicase RhlE n=1 Tax=Thermonema lapsum TaxID=28195 RepID=A0A846MRR6_9BACT|nr:DEAD/DEAH box helicase [Thermonema lapsum]NIK74284.1 ATP-dependent RNA helicase RhlE [Thermonema lapsum]